MKTALSIISQMAFTLIFASTILAAGIGGGIRERLINNPSVEALYAVDERHTFIKGEAAFMDGGVNIIKRYGYENQALRGLLVSHEAEPYIFRTAGSPIGTLERRDVELAGPLATADLFQEMTSICRLNSGAASFVITKKDGRYKRLMAVEPVEAFEFIFTARGESAWYMACSGEKRFAVEKNYSSVNKGRNIASIIPGRGLEGVDYVRAGKAAVESWQAPKETPEELMRFRANMAWEIASVQTGFVKPHNGARYIGTYSSDRSCDNVSIREIGSDDRDGRIYDFKVCSDKVAFIGERDGSGANLKDMYANR